MVGQHAASRHADKCIGWQTGLIESEGQEGRGIENIKIKMDREMLNPLAHDPVQHWGGCFSQTVRASISQSKAFNHLILNRRPRVQSGVHHSRRNQRDLDLAYEIRFTTPEKNSKHVRVRVGSALG